VRALPRLKTTLVPVHGTHCDAVAAVCIQLAIVSQISNLPVLNWSATQLLSLKSKVLENETTADVAQHDSPP
jgi:hypothetical protein